MTSAAAATPVKYHVQIAPVREVTLFGTADLEYWKPPLRKADLYPANGDGRAQILISAVDSKFMGVRFREVSVSVAASLRTDGANRDGFFLVHAWNSVRFFAFVERTFFSTPYYHGTLQVDPRLPASCQVSKGGALLLRAAMGPEPTAATRTPSRSGEECWEGPIFLPGGPPRRVFFAKLAGPGQVYPFAATDAVTLNPAPASPVLQMLVESRFAGKEWLLREAGTHGKSKTVKRSAAGL